MRALTFLILPTLLLSACSSSLTVTRYDPSQDLQGAGVVYFLPKTELQLRFNVEIIARPGESCARILDDCESVAEPGDLKLTGVELVGITLPDDKAGFVLESRGTVVTETDFTATLDESGQLLSTNAVTDDQGMETLSWGVDTVAKLFKTAVMAGSSDLKVTQLKAIRQDQILKALRLKNEAVDAALSESGDPRAVLDAQDDIAALFGELAAVQDSLMEVITLPVVCSLDPSAFVETTDERSTQVFVIDPQKGLSCPEYEWVHGWFQTSGLANMPALPSLTVSMLPLSSMETTYQPEDQWYRLTLAAGVAGKGTVPGLVYRVPAWFEISVMSEKGPVLKETMAIPQLGRLAALTVEAEAMRRNRTLQITLHPTLGSLKDVHYSLSPMDLESAQALSDSVMNIPTTQSDLETQHMNSEVDRINAELAYLAAQQALQDAQDAFDAANDNNADSESEEDDHDGPSPPTH